MCIDIIDGISAALNAYFGDEYRIYAEPLEQGLSLPCFFVNHEDTVKKKMLGDRFIAHYSFDVSYYPKNSKLEMLETAEKLYECLNIIELAGGDLVRGRSMRYTISNGILHFYVSFSLILETEAEHDYMGAFNYRLV